MALTTYRLLLMAKVVHFECFHWSSNETKALVLAWKERMVENQMNDMPIVRNSMEIVRDKVMRKRITRVTSFKNGTKNHPYDSPFLE